MSVVTSKKIQRFLVSFAYFYIKSFLFTHKIYLLIRVDVHTLAKDLYILDVYIHAFLYNTYPYIAYTNTHLYGEVILLIPKYIYK